jgi:predicted nucleic-acid-binding protein
MRAVDTNVLVRLLTRDDTRQWESADRWVEPGAWVPILALAETVWVLSTAYGRSPGEIASVIEILLNHKSLTLQDSDAVALALKSFRKRPSLGFADCLLLELARKAGHLPLGTFDRELSKLDGAEKL